MTVALCLSEKQVHYENKHGKIRQDIQNHCRGYHCRALFQQHYLRYSGRYSDDTGRRICTYEFRGSLPSLFSFRTVNKKEGHQGSMNYVMLILIGVVAGLLGGLLGIGGAVIIIPALVLLLGYSQYEAQGTTLLMLVMPVSSVAAWHYYKNGHVNIPAAIVLGLTFLVGSYFGARLATYVPAEMLKKAFALILIVIAVKLLFFERASEV
jgi:hypothetical protein